MFSDIHFVKITCFSGDLTGDETKTKVESVQLGKICVLVLKPSIEPG